MLRRGRTQLMLTACLVLATGPLVAAGTQANQAAEDLRAAGGRRDVVLGDQPQEPPAPATPSGPPSADAAQILNINFGMPPRDVRPNGAIGGPHDVWTLVDVGETSKTSLPMADGTPTDVSLKFSQTDGEWGIPGAFDTYHAYLYHNARNVDLTLTLQNLPAGRYDVYVFAHGAAPEQNAAIEVDSGGKHATAKATIKDGSMSFLSREHHEGVQYVRYTVKVKKSQPLVITSRRDGSDLAMFNAVQLHRLPATQKSRRKRRGSN